MKTKRNTTDEPTFNGRPIMTDAEQGLRCDKIILATIDKTLNHALESNDRIFFMRYDVGTPVGYTDTSNEAFRNGQANFMKHLKRNGFKPHYVAVRELSKEKRNHYHAILMLDGRKTQSIHDHIEKADELFANAFGIPGAQGIIDDCTKARDGSRQDNGIMLRRGDPEFNEKVDEAFRVGSYLAKENQKSNKTERDRERFSSRVPKSKSTAS